MPSTEGSSMLSPEGSSYGRGKCAERGRVLLPQGIRGSAHTFLGWTYSFKGDYEGAIRECQIAIDVDPDFGNPYNDIGAYLIELGRHEEAIPWLKKAMQAKRYEPRHFPHFNLARAYVRQRKIYEAIRELKLVLELEPEYKLARAELHRLLGMLN